MELAVLVLQEIVKHMEQTGSTRKQVRLSVDAELLHQLNQHTKEKYNIEDVRKAVDKCLAHQWLEKIGLGNSGYTNLRITEKGVGIAVSKTKQEELKAARSMLKRASDYVVEHKGLFILLGIVVSFLAVIVRFWRCSS